MSINLLSFDLFYPAVLVCCLQVASQVRAQLPKASAQIALSAPTPHQECASTAPQELQTQSLDPKAAQVSVLYPATMLNPWHMTGRVCRGAVLPQRGTAQLSATSVMIIRMRGSMVSSDHRNNQTW